jgi:hypothetical protein
MSTTGILTQLADAMQCFEDATLTLEGHAQFAEFGQMGECIPIIEALSTQLTKLQNEYPLPSTFPTTNLDNLPKSIPTTSQAQILQLASSRNVQIAPLPSLQTTTERQTTRFGSPQALL